MGAGLVVASRPRASRSFGAAVDALLLTAVVVIPARAVASVSLDHTLPFGALVWISLAALAAGTLAASSGLKDWTIQLFGSVLGFVGVVYFIARNVPGMPADAGLSERVAEIGLEVVRWYQTVASGNQATNNLLFLFLLSLVAWTIGFFSAWAVFRERSAWWPVTVSAISLTLVLATFPNLYPYMIVELIAAMLLIGRMNLEAREAVWQAHGIRLAGGVGGRAFRSSVALSVALVALAWLAPTALASKPLSESLGQTQGPWRDAQTEFNRLFGGLQARSEASLSGFGRVMTFHGSFHLADTPVLKVEAPQPEYWRAVVFDQYTGHGWLSSDPLDQRTLAPGDDVLKTPDVAREDLTQVVTVLAPRGNLLVGASQPSLFDRPVSAQAYGATAVGDGVDLVSVASEKPIEADTQYTVVSRVSAASAPELRQAGRDYPAAIRARYVSLPPIPERVRRLAQQTTAGASNPYDQSVAVETYLRAIPYSLDLPNPPPDRDGVDFFLFDSRTGYCDYFASAMAVMLRTQGIPARVVSGYATGARQSDGSFLVKDSDSHTWVEVFFPRYGWIPFEPSGGWPRFPRGAGAGARATASPVARPVTPTPAPAAAQARSSTQQGTPTPAPTPTTVGGVNPATTASKRAIDLRPLLPLLVFLGVLAGLATLAWYLWERDLRGLPPAVVAYAKMTRLATLLGFGPRRSETPVEYGQALAGAVPEAGSNVARIAHDYTRYRFGRHDSEPGRPSPAGPRPWRLVRNALLRRLGRLSRA